jgi:hypothetical protein
MRTTARPLHPATARSHVTKSPNTRSRWVAVTGALLFLTTTAGAQGFSCLDLCTDTFGVDIISSSGVRLVLTSCSQIMHDDHYHTHCYYRA